MTDIDRPTPKAWSFDYKDKTTGLLVAEAGYLGADGMLHCYSSRWSGERIYPAQDWKMAMGHAGGGWTW